MLSDLPDLETLLAGLPTGAEVHVLDTSGDALAQMADILGGRSGIDAIPLFSHGSAGQLSLGTNTLTSASQASNGDALVKIGSALSHEDSVNARPEHRPLPAAS
ncbi:MAG: vcbs [uncultured bacterium]|nr:MAG: vcbs [uncultured bacterium]